jgi:dihydrofolate synthase/folylpolyglutamate synthase
MDMAKQFGKVGEVQLHLSAAIDRARDLADKRDLILITGSLFTVGEAKSYLDPIRCPIEDI